MKFSIISSFFFATMHHFFHSSLKNWLGFSAHQIDWRTENMLAEKTKYILSVVWPLWRSMAHQLGFSHFFVSFFIYILFSFVNIFEFAFSKIHRNISSHCFLLFFSSFRRILFLKFIEKNIRILNEIANCIRWQNLKVDKYKQLRRRHKQQINGLTGFWIDDSTSSGVEMPKC